MLLMPLICSLIETSLNRLLFTEQALQPARQRLAGKVLQIRATECATPLTLLFSEQRVDVQGQWQGTADCSLSMSLTLLPKLRDRQQLTGLIRSNLLRVEGDPLVVQQWISLLELVPWDPAELLAPYLGDIAAEGISQWAQRGGAWLRQRVQRDQTCLVDALVEEWRLLPSALEVAWFDEQVSMLENSVNGFTVRLEKMENQP